MNGSRYNWSSSIFKLVIFDDLLNWWVSFKAHKARAWSAEFSKTALDGKFLKIFLIIVKNFYILVKINEKLCTGAFEFRLRTWSIMLSNLLLVAYKKLQNFFYFSEFWEFERRGHLVKKIGLDMKEISEWHFHVLGGAKNLNPPLISLLMILMTYCQRKLGYYEL